MIQQVQAVCSDCSGKGMSSVASDCHVTSYIGTKIKEEDKCDTCKGKQLVKDKKVLEVHIEKGMRDGQKIVFAGESDQAVCVIGCGWVVLINCYRSLEQSLEILSLS